MKVIFRWLYLFDRLGKILTMLILTRGRKVTMIPLTSVKLDTRYVCAYCVCRLLLTTSSIFW